MAGRPTGSVETPRTMITKELRHTVTLNRRVRELLTKMVITVEKELDGATLKQKLEAIEVLMAGLQSSNGGIEKIAKHVIGAPEDEVPTGEGAIESILAELKGGK